MSEELITKIYQITKKFSDPLLNQPLDKDNINLNLICKNKHANLSITINPNNQNKHQELSNELKKALKGIKELLSVNIIFTAEKTLSKPSDDKRKFKSPAKNIIAIASGKGGVGKSTFAVNFAVALEQLGHKVGILDADIYGPSIPRMMGLSGRPEANANHKLVPLENYNIQCMSIGFLIGVDTPTIWRGPMVMKALEQMFNGVEWGDLDYLIIDLPPGTGDAQLTLAQSSKLNGSIIISTPQDVALIDARKGINMFNKVNVPVLGIVENMSYFICSNCNERHEIFANGGAKKEAETSNNIFLGELPLDTLLRVHSDNGQPICALEPENYLSKIYIKIAEKIHLQVNN